MQQFFREWDARDCQACESAFIDVLGVDIMRKLHYELVDDLPGEALVARFSENVRLMESLAAAIFLEVARLLPDFPNRPINPYAITLNADLWEEEGLFDPEKAVQVEEVAAGTMDKIRLTPVANTYAGTDMAHAG
jgi:hypothetical protein